MTSQIDRQFLLLRIIADVKCQWDVETLAARFSTSAKTIRRDISNLRRAGFKIDESNGPNGKKFYRVDVTAELPLHLTFDEALALFIGGHVGTTFSDSELGQAAASAIEKLRITLGPLERKYLDVALPRFFQPHVGSDYTKHADIIDALRIAIEDCRAIFIEYRSARSTESVSYDIHPFALVEHRGSLYVIGYSCHHDAIRTWKVDRISEAELTKMPFERPQDFDIATYMKDAFAVVTGAELACIRVRFSPSAGRYVFEKRMHHSQTLVTQPDGFVVATFELSSTMEIKSWILSFGCNAEVLEPQSLRREILAELSSLVELYGEVQSSKTESAKKTPCIKAKSKRTISRN